MYEIQSSPIAYRAIAKAFIKAFIGFALVVVASIFVCGLFALYSPHAPSVAKLTAYISLFALYIAAAWWAWTTFSIFEIGVSEERAEIRKLQFSVFFLSLAVIVDYVKDNL